MTSGYPHYPPQSAVPFGVAIDAQNRVWVSNAQSDTVVRRRSIEGPILPRWYRRAWHGLRTNAAESKHPKG